MDYWTSQEPLVQALLAVTVGLPALLLLAALFAVLFGVLLGAISGRRKAPDDDLLRVR